MLRSPLIAPAAQDEVAILYVGFELSKKTWLIGLYAPELGKTISRHKIDGGDVNAALELVATAARRLGKLGRPVRVVSVYEAGLYEGHACQEVFSGSHSFLPSFQGVHASAVLH